jgi:hypothetical protein
MNRTPAALGSRTQGHLWRPSAHVPLVRYAYCVFCIVRLLTICKQNDFEPHLSKPKPKKGHRYNDILDIDDVTTLLANEVDHYLNALTENVTTEDLIRWWRSKAKLYPCLSHMALNYLSIPGVVSLLVLRSTH